MTTFTSPFTGDVIQPTDVSYYALNFSTNTQLYWPAVVNSTQVPAARIMDCVPQNTIYTVLSNTRTTFTVFGNQTAIFAINTSIVFDFTAGATIYTVTNSVFNGTNTVVTFSGALGVGVTVALTSLILQVILPAGNQGSVGSDILFRNKGSVPFVINANSLDASVIINPGISLYFYLTDNSTVDGVWQNITFGAGVSYADAATLAGAGLTTVSGKLATTQNIVDLTSAPTITDASRAITYVWNGGNGTFTLPIPANLSNGWYIGFRNNGTGALSLTPTSPALINNQTTITANPGDSGFILYDATSSDFVTVGLTAPSNVTFTSATYDVDAISGNTLSLVSYAPIIQTYIAQSGTRTATLAVSLPAITQIYILVNNTNQIGYNVTFQIQGSSQPPLNLASGNVFTVLSDGINLYVLTSTSVGLFFAANGSAATPAYSFNNDTFTGMYLKNTSVLAMTANATEMLEIDNSNVSAPVVSTPARFNASSISGGTF